MKSSGKHLMLMIQIFLFSVRNLGFAAIPGAEEDFHAELDVALKYAKALKCKK